MNKVVYNACYGGFTLSPLAVKKYYEEKYPEVKLYFYVRDYTSNTLTKITDDLGNYNYDDVTILTKDFGDSFVHGFMDKNQEFEDSFVWIDHELKRHDPILVKIVEELGEKASGHCSRLRIREIEGNAYRIDEYDGYETVIESYDDWVIIDENDNTGGE